MARRARVHCHNARFLFAQDCLKPCALNHPIEYNRSSQRCDTDLDAALRKVYHENLNVSHMLLLQWHHQGVAMASYNAVRRAHPPHQFTSRHPHSQCILQDRAKSFKINNLLKLLQLIAVRRKPLEMLR
jgi:hypothetical protein